MNQCHVEISSNMQFEMEQQKHNVEIWEFFRQPDFS